jgi:hypothetical protein
MRKVLAAMVIVFGLLWGIAVADGTNGTDYPAVVVNNNHLEDLLPLYAQPREDSTKLGEYINGTTAWLLEEQGGWAHVRLGDGTEGYFFREQVTNMEPLTGLVPLERARARGFAPNVVLTSATLYEYPLPDAPTSEVPMAMRLDIQILRPFGTWYHVRLPDGREGYIPCQYLDVMSSQTLEEAALARGGNVGVLLVVNPNFYDRLHLRAKPSQDSASLGRYFNGTMVEVLSTEQVNGVYWAHVRVGGKEGYMMHDFLNTIYWKEAEWANG